MQIDLKRIDRPFASAFRIAYRVRTAVELLIVELSDCGHVGRGETAGVSYLGETADSMLALIADLGPAFSARLTRDSLQSRLPPGGARNAIDCALWDLEAKRSGRRAWELAGLASVHPVATAFTIGLDSPFAMAEAAQAAHHYPLLKLKLGGSEDVERVAAVRDARPDSRLIVDANQAWELDQLQAYAGRLADLGVELIEQPLAAGKDDQLAGFQSPIPLCADESCQTAQSLPSIVGKYDYVNIKLDKVGGLTAALGLASAARSLGLKLMAGCMAGSSLGIAPAFILAQTCDLVDLDGPLLLASDEANAISYEQDRVQPPEPALWG